MMASGDYSISFDRTGFPLVQRHDWRHAIALFPISKYQFERFMVEQGPQGTLFTDAWYRELLALNPRRSWRRSDERPWELFLTGLEAEPMVSFLRFLGRGYRLPEVAEWRALLAVEAELSALREQFLEASHEAAAPVRHWLARGLFPLCHEGLVEQVREETCTRFIGRPYPKWLPNAWNPGTVRDADWALARRVVGFRVVAEGHRR
jgi:hypothetical protein